MRNPETTTDILVAGASDFARVDPDYDGGLTGSWKAALAAEALGLDVEVHALGPAMRHLMASLRSSNYYEVNLVHPRNRERVVAPRLRCGYSDELDTVEADGCVPVRQVPASASPTTGTT